MSEPQPFPKLTETEIADRLQRTEALLEESRRTAAQAMQLAMRAAQLLREATSGRLMDGDLLPPGTYLRDDGTTLTVSEQAGEMHPDACRVTAANGGYSASTFHTRLIPRPENLSGETASLPPGR